VLNRITIILVLLLAALTVGCNKTDSNTNQALATTRAGADNSTITTTTDANGNTVETREFRDNGRVSKVVVTTRNGKRTAVVYSKSGETRELKEGDADKALDSTGDAIADSAGWVADKSVDVADKTKDAAVKTADVTTDTAKKVGDKTEDAATAAARKTKEAAKKTGRAVKKVIP
jgi:major membrane immunogen (membrane-anchored lipoprotein)